MKNLEDILKGCINHEEKSQQILFNKFKNLYMGIAMRYLNDREMAKDVVQLSFIKIFNSLPDLEKLSSFESWSRRIVINTALNKSRKKRTHDNLFVVNEENKFKGNTDVELSIIRKIDNEYLMKLIKSMPEGYQRVFNLYMIDGFSHAEIADMFGITKSTSRSQLSKAKKYLNELITNLNVEEDGRAFGG